MSQLDLHLVFDGGTTPMSFEMKRMINAGYVGRDQSAVLRHIEELARMGVAPPDSVPSWFPMVCRSLSFADCIETVERTTSGEVEFVLLIDGQDIYVGVGSDHTDRSLEAVDVLKSKQACPNVMSRNVWLLADVRGHWDQLVMCSWVRNDGPDWIPYQEGLLGSILSADQLIERTRDMMVDGCSQGLVIFSGTVPVLSATIDCSRFFRCELRDPVRGRSLECVYEVKRLNYLKTTVKMAGLLGQPDSS